MSDDGAPRWLVILSIVLSLMIGAGGLAMGWAGLRLADEANEVAQRQARLMESELAPKFWISPTGVNPMYRTSR